MKTLFVVAMTLGLAMPAFADGGKSKLSASWQVAQNQDTQNQDTQTASLRVVLGDTIGNVRAAYGITADPLPTRDEQLMLVAPADGLTFFFKEKDQMLRNIRADAHFAGSINGVRIGDTLDSVVAKFGQPSRDPFDFNDNKAYVFSLGSTWFRCDFDKEQKVATMFLLVKDR